MRRTATGENIVEYQCHGGRATVDALLAALLGRSGIRLAEPGEFTRRALANGRIDLTEAEGLAELLDGRDRASAALGHCKGGRCAPRTSTDGVINCCPLSAQAEVAIDYADER